MTGLARCGLRGTVQPSGTIGRAMAVLSIGVGSALPLVSPYRLSGISPVVQDSIPLASITTDTGAYAPGNRDFSRFTTPGLCIAAGDEATDVLRRSAIAQTTLAMLRDTAPEQNTLPPAAVAIARTCAARFTVAGVDTSNLADLFTLSLMANHDSIAQATVTRRLAVAVTKEDKTAVMQEAVTGYLAAEPARVAAATTLVAQIDGFGTSMQAERLLAHGQLLEFAWSTFDEPTMQREANRIIALGKEVPTAAIKYDYNPIILAYKALGEIAYVEAHDSVPAVLARAKEDLSRFPTADSFPSGKSFSFLQMINYKRATVTQIRDAFLPFNADQYAGQSLPPVSAAYWFPKAPSSWPPGNGTPSLIFYGGMMTGSCLRNDANILIWPLANGCIELHTILPELVRHYGSRLSITLVAQTKGNAARSLVLPPAAEADTLAWLLREHFQLPVRVGVVADSVWRFAAPDGRWFHQDTTFYGKKHAVDDQFDMHPLVLLYGEHGTLRYMGAADFPVLRTLLARTMTTTTSPR